MMALKEGHRSLNEYHNRTRNGLRRSYTLSSLSAFRPTPSPSPISPLSTSLKHHHPKALDIIPPLSLPASPLLRARVQYKERSCSTSPTFSVHPSPCLMAIFNNTPRPSPCLDAANFNGMIDMTSLASTVTSVQNKNEIHPLLPPSVVSMSAVSSSMSPVAAAQPSVSEVCTSASVMSVSGQRGNKHQSNTMRDNQGEQSANVTIEDKTRSAVNDNRNSNGVTIITTTTSSGVTNSGVNGDQRSVFNERTQAMLRLIFLLHMIGRYINCRSDSSSGTAANNHRAETGTS